MIIENDAMLRGRNRRKADKRPVSGSKGIGKSCVFASPGPIAEDSTTFHP
jgi:hypothetical protein